jgi:hypothetical protein
MESAIKNYFQVPLHVKLIDFTDWKSANLISKFFKPINSLSNDLTLQNKIALVVVFKTPFAVFQTEVIIPIN